MQGKPLTSLENYSLLFYYYYIINSIHKQHFYEKSINQDLDNNFIISSVYFNILKNLYLCKTFIIFFFLIQGQNEN